MLVYCNVLRFIIILCSDISVAQRSINEAATDWGLKCLRYEIRDISPPKGVRVAMEMQEEAERRKRAQILESEGDTT